MGRRVKADCGRLCRFAARSAADTARAAGDRLCEGEQARIVDHGGLHLDSVLDPPPLWPLIEAALKSGDSQFQVRVISILQARAPTAWFHIMVALTEVLRGKTGPEVKETALKAMMAMERPTTVGPNAALAEPETHDTDSTALSIK